MNIWEEKYAAGKECNVAPFDEVISFVYRHKPDLPNKQVRILEVGCGTGNNINFLALQGFQTYGIDSSPTAVAHAKKGFSKVSQGSFVTLPWGPAVFDMVIDRAGLTCAGPEDLHRSIESIWRVLKPGGTFLFTPYAMPGKQEANYYDYKTASGFFNSDKWQIVSAQKAETFDHIQGKLIEAHWRMVYRKV
jgi:SAM-dependent methyltransferase